MTDDIKHEVRIHIDRKQYESPNPTTGHALYELGGVGAHKELFREVDGDKEDELVPNDDSKIHLKQDEHFYSERDYKVIVNGVQKTVTDHTLTYAQVVALDPTPGTGKNPMYNISYYNGPHKNPQGELLPGQSVKVKDGMVFNVTPTNQS